MTLKSILFIAASLAAGTALRAQDSAYNQLNEVVVTANRYEQKQSTTGKVVTVIGREIIEKSKGKTVAQLLNEQAGVTVNGALSNMGSVQTVYMRGASSGRALILLDGVPVNDPSMINNEFDLNFFSINEVERIEICRGAQSTLYGSDAVAGVINIITVKKDVAKPLNVNATIAGGNLNTWRGNVQVYGKSNKLSYSARYAKLYTDGFSAARDTTGKGNFDKDGYNGDVVSSRLEIAATSKLSFNTFMQYSTYKSEIDNSGFTDDKDYTIHHKSMLAGAGFHYKNEAVSITGNYRYNELHRNFLNDSTDGYPYLSQAFYSKTNFAEIYASVNLGSGFTLLQGGEYRYGSMNSALRSIYPPFDPYSESFKDTSLSQASLYSSLNYSGINNRLNVELGGRLNVHSRYGSNKTYSFNPSFAVNDQFRLFGSIATGFKAPTLYQLYSPYGDEALLPEQSVNYEAGVQLNEKKFNTRLVYFYRHIKDGLDFNNVNFKYFNDIRQIVRGMEVELTAHPVEALSISANYSYLVPDETTQLRTDFTKDTTYTYLLRRPRHHVNATVGYEYKDFFVSVSGKYVSKRYDAGGYLAPDVQLGDYFLLNAYAAYKINGHVKLFAEAKNIFNTKFYDVYGYNSIPFQMNAGVSVNF